MFNRINLSQLGKFTIIGITNTAISYIFFYVLYNYFLIGNVFYSQCLGYAAGIVWSFIWNKKWTFSFTNISYSVFFSFLFLQLILLITSAFLLAIAKASINWNINLIWVVVTAIITIINFLFTKFLVFKDNGELNR
jgi:putative flippase GtrA